MPGTWHSEDRMTVEFAPWQTQIANATVDLLEVRYLDGRLESDYPQKGRRYRKGPRTPGLPNACELAATLFVPDEERIYRIKYAGVEGFRVLDERGLMELWDATASGGRPANTTFRVRGHGWSRESPLTFCYPHECWSWMLASDWDCLEVVCNTEPVVERLEAVETAAEDDAR